MAEGTIIEWARHPVTGLGATWNIVTGCSVVSPGCTNCYAMKLAGTRLKHHPSREGLTVDTKSGPVWNGQTRFNDQWLTQPLGWKKSHGIFVAAHGDLFAEGVTDDQLDRIFAVMALCPQHIFYVLTKRPERMRDYLTNGSDEKIVEQIRALGAAAEARSREKPGRGFRMTPDEVLASDAFAISFNIEHRYAQWPLPNVWLGVSVEDQKRADERIPVLLDTPAAIRFISAEPLLGPIEVNGYLFIFTHEDEAALSNPRPGLVPLLPFRDPATTPAEDICTPRLDWVIAGGESGPGARPCHPDWIRGLRDQCAEADVAFFFKQWGAAIPVYGANHAPLTADVYDGPIIDGVGFAFVGKKAAGRTIDMREHTAWPAVRPDTGGAGA